VLVLLRSDKALLDWLDILALFFTVERPLDIGVTHFFKAAVVDLVDRVVLEVSGLVAIVAAVLVAHGFYYSKIPIDDKRAWRSVPKS
jgi:hypothetical protein